MTKSHKILILHTGGTFGMTLDSQNQHLLDAHNCLSDLVARVPEVLEIAQIEVEVLFNIDSSFIDHRHWTKIAQTIVATPQKNRLFSSSGSYLRRWNRINSTAVANKNIGTKTAPRPIKVRIKLPTIPPNEPAQSISEK